MATQLCPSYDNKIFRKYSTRTIESKIENKLKMQEECGWPQEKNLPLACLPSGMSEDLGGALFEELIDGILQLPLQIVVRGIGSRRYGEMLTNIERAQPHKLRILADAPHNQRKIYAASDIALFFSPPAGGDPELLHCLSYGTIPIGPQADSLEDYNPVQEAGNAFTCDPCTPWMWFTSLVRALETYKLPFDWRTIQRHAMDAAKEVAEGEFEGHDEI